MISVITLTKTNYLAKADLKGIDKGICPVYWLRGLTPLEWFPTIPHTDLVAHAGGHEAFPKATLFGSDGSGGKHSRDPRLRSCGAGAVAITATGSIAFVGGAYATFAGKQTVPAAELIGICLILAVATAPK